MTPGCGCLQGYPAQSFLFLLPWPSWCHPWQCHAVVSIVDDLGLLGYLPCQPSGAFLAGGDSKDPFKTQERVETADLDHIFLSCTLRSSSGPWKGLSWQIPKRGFFFLVAPARCPMYPPLLTLREVTHLTPLCPGSSRAVKARKN